MRRIRTCLWFENGGMKAAKFYTNLIPNSKMGTSDGLEDIPEPLMVNFELDGVPYQIINGGPHFKLNEAMSIVYNCDNQTELDRVWDALLGDNGIELQCGWLRDQFGLCWQIIPNQLMEALMSPDRAAAKRAETAMFEMKRIEIKGILDAFNG